MLNYTFAWATGRQIKQAKQRFYAYFGLVQENRIYKYKSLIYELFHG